MNNNLAPVNLGLIGAGNWGYNYIHAIQKLPKINLVAIATRNKDRKKIHLDNCKIFDSWRDLCEIDYLDGVIIATPTKSHIKIAKNAIENRLPVLIEKPLSLSINDANKFYEYVENKEAKVIVNFIHLYNPIYIEMKKWINSIGDVQQIETKAGDWGPFRLNTPPLWDWGCHDIAMCLDIVRKTPIQIKKKVLKSLNNNQFKKVQTPENIEIRLGFGDNLNACIRIGNLLKKKSRFMRVKCGDSLIEFDDIKKELLINRKNNIRLINNILMKNISPLECVIMEFVNQIQSKDVKNENIKLAVEVTNILGNI